MRKQIFARVEKSLGLYDDLLAAIPQDSLALRLGGEECYSLGDQFWCLIGARESYVKAMEAGSWQGFSCSLSAEGVKNKSAIATSLSSSHSLVKGFLAEFAEWDESREAILLDLIEHEIRHQGQLIRYFKHFELDFPESWLQAYHL